jgi:hypothetical protein
VYSTRIILCIEVEEPRRTIKMNSDKILKEFEEWLENIIATDFDPNHTFIEGLIVARGKLRMLKEGLLYKENH